MNRYWIGGTGNWSDPSHWSDTSGGSPYQPISGVEKVVNGDFSSSAGWSLNNATISNGLLNVNSNIDGDVVASRIDFVLTKNKWYKVTYEVSNYVSGSIRVLLSDYSYISYSSGNETKLSYRLLPEVSSYRLVFITGSSGFVGSIDNISVQEVDTISPDSTTNCIIDQNSGIGTITVNVAANMLDFDVTGLTANVTLSNAVYNFSVYGNLKLSNFLITNFTSTGYLYLLATTSVGIWANGTTKSWNRIYMNGVGGTWTNQDDWNMGSTDFYFNSGTWTTNDKTITTTNNINTASNSTLNLGSTTLNCLNWTSTTSISFIINSGTSTINVMGQAFQGGGKKYYNVNLLNAGYPIQYIRNSDQFVNLTKYGNNSIVSSLYIQGNIIISGIFNVQGNNNTNYRTVVLSDITGTQRTITAANVIASNVDFRDIKFTNPIDLSAITGGSGDCGGNTNITFTPAQTQYFKHTSGAVNWSDSTKWFSDYARTVQGRVPLPQDNAIFDDLSFTGTSTLTINVANICGFNFSAINNNIDIKINQYTYCYGDWFGSSKVTQYGSGTNTFSMAKRGTIYVDTKNVPIAWFYTMFPISNSNVQLLSDLNIIGIYQLGIGGNFHTNGYSINTYTIQNTYFCNLYLYNSVVNVRSNFYGNWSGSVDAGTSIINKSGSGTLYTSGRKYNIINILNSCSFEAGVDVNVLNINSGITVKFSGGYTYKISKMIAKGTALNPITITSTTGTTFTLVKTQPLSEKIECDYLNLSYSTVTPTKTWYAGSNSIDGGNNTNWIFGKFTSRDIIVQNNKKILVDNNGRIVW